MPALIIVHSVWSCLLVNIYIGLLLLLNGPQKTDSFKLATPCRWLLKGKPQGKVCMCDSLEFGAQGTTGWCSSVLAVNCFIITNSVTDVQHTFQQEYSDSSTGQMPTRNTNCAYMKQWEEHGYVHNRKRSGPWKTVRVTKNVELMSAVLQWYPLCSAWWHPNATYVIKKLDHDSACRPQISSLQTAKCVSAPSP